MNINDSLGRSHFSQLYFQAAKIRGDELAEFFRRFQEGPDSQMSAAELASATEMAGDIQEFLQRVSTYMNEAAHLGEARVQRQ